MSNNPYRAGAPVGGDTDAFVGRENILNAIKNVANDLHRNALVLYGQRRIGKTSLLKQTEMLLQESYCPIFVDWQEKADWPLSRVLEELAYVVSISLGQAKPSSLGTDPSESFKQWLAEQLLNPQNKPLLFLFDEFDVIATSKATKDILIYLRKLLTLNAQRLTVIFSVGCKIEQLPDEWFKIREIENQFISLFTRTETEELIRLSEKNQTLKWTDAAIDEVWRLAAGHPFFTQQLCAKVWDYLYQKNPSQPPLVVVNHINTILPQLDTSDNVLQSLWRSLSPAEQIVAIILAQPQIQWTEFIKPLKKIESLLEQAKNSLIEWELINEQSNDSYHFKVEIIRRYVETRKEYYYDNLEALVSHHASNIYDIAKQLHEEGNNESAKALLKQVNLLNPYHTKASLLLADILIAEKRFEPARQVLENLYLYNSDAASKQLINVLLELAELQEQDETQQLALYNRVLDIQANHFEATKAKQTILQQQQNRSWKKRFSNFYRRYTKRVWEVIGLFVIFVISVFLSFQYYPSNIVLEIKTDKTKNYILTGLPTMTAYQFKEITIIPPQSIEFEQVLLTYNKNKGIEVKIDKKTGNYLIDKTILPATKENNEIFQYPSQKEYFPFQLNFTLKEGVANESVEFECQFTNKQEKNLPACEIRGGNFLTIFRGIPLYGIVLLLSTILIIAVEISYAIFIEREKDDVF